MKIIPLSRAAKYSKQKIDASLVSLENFVTTDNILQNKLGVTIATNLPLGCKTMPSYQPENILVGNIRPYLKKIWYANRSGGSSPDVLVFEVNKEFDSKFIYYSLFRDDFFIHMMKGSKGTKMPRGNKDQVLDFLIPDFQFSDQKKIAAVLSALDAKIELNNCINAELEKMAKTIYDYWFVQFDFPNANGKPYKSSGGKMVWSNELKREIPTGWEVLQLSNKLTFEKGVEPGSAKYTAKKETMNHIKFIRIGDIENNDSSIFIDNSDKKYATVNEKDVLVTFDGSVGKVAFGFEGAYSSGLRKIYDKFGLIDNSLIYSLFKDTRLIKTIHKYATGSILLHAGASINNLKIPYNEEKYLQFQNIIKPFFSKMVINKQQNQTLANLRDWLLPMLMNGQVKVK